MGNWGHFTPKICIELVHPTEITGFWGPPGQLPLLPKQNAEYLYHLESIEGGFHSQVRWISYYKGP